MARPAGLEPATIRLEGGCSIQLSYGRIAGILNLTGSVDGRSGGIRTPDILLPKQTRYQAALHSVRYVVPTFQEVRIIPMPRAFVNEKTAVAESLSNHRLNATQTA